jgi:hypothetical protein
MSFTTSGKGTDDWMHNLQGSTQKKNVGPSFERQGKVPKEGKPEGWKEKQETPRHGAS